MKVPLRSQQYVEHSRTFNSLNLFQSQTHSKLIIVLISK